MFITWIGEHMWILYQFRKLIHSLGPTNPCALFVLYHINFGTHNNLYSKKIRLIFLKNFKDNFTVEFKIKIKRNCTQPLKILNLSNGWRLNNSTFNCIVYTIQNSIKEEKKKIVSCWSISLLFMNKIQVWPTAGWLSLYKKTIWLFVARYVLFCLLYVSLYPFYHLAFGSVFFNHEPKCANHRHTQQCKFFKVMRLNFLFIYFG